MILEILSDSVESAQAAVRGGADRIELCENILEGGVTPSIGFMEMTRKHIDIDINVMIRPRGGDFLYTDIEFEVMKRNIMAAKAVGIQGVVLGLLLKDGSVDVARTAELVELAHPLSVTFHRAFDVCRDPIQALHDVMETGAERVLTSGLSESALEGADEIRKYIELSSGKLIIMPGGGINDTNITELAIKTGATEFHLSAKKLIKSQMDFRRESLNIGYIPNEIEYSRYFVDEEKVRRVRELLMAVSQ